MLGLFKKKQAPPADNAQPTEQDIERTKRRRRLGNTAT
jgi:hypothetical protein